MKFFTIIITALLFFSSNIVNAQDIKVKHENLILSKHISKEYKIPFSLAKEIVELVKFHAKATDLSPKIVLAVIAVESSFNPKAISSKGAKGLMQIMPLHKPGPTIEDNIIKGIWILQDYKSETSNIYEALMSYNVGITAFKKGKRNYNYAKKVMKKREKFEDVLQGKF